VERCCALNRSPYSFGKFSREFLCDAGAAIQVSVEPDFLRVRTPHIILVVHGTPDNSHPSFFCRIANHLQRPAEKLFDDFFAAPEGTISGRDGSCQMPD
jgi:hypothetical protein